MKTINTNLTKNELSFLQLFEPELFEKKGVWHVRAAVPVIGDEERTTETRCTSLHTADKREAQRRALSVHSRWMAELDRMRLLQTSARRKYDAITMAHCTPEDWALIVKQAVSDAKAGDSCARAWVTRVLFGDRRRVTARMQTKDATTGATVHVAAEMDEESAPLIAGRLGSRAANLAMDSGEVERLRQKTQALLEQLEAAHEQLRIADGRCATVPTPTAAGLRQREV